MKPRLRVRIQFLSRKGQVSGPIAVGDVLPGAVLARSRKSDPVRPVISGAKKYVVQWHQRPPEGEWNLERRLVLPGGPFYRRRRSRMRGK